MTKKIIKKLFYKLFTPKSSKRKGINSTIDANTKVGDYSYIGYNCSITKSIIGRYVSIANNVAIGQGEHLIDEISTNSIFYDNPYEILTKKEVFISDDVWLGVNTVVLRGVTIGRGAIIGAGAIVTKDVPAYAIVVGIPAKVLKFRFNSKQIEEIEKSKWWNHTPDEAKQIFLNVKDSIKKL